MHRISLACCGNEFQNSIRRNIVLVARTITSGQCITQSTKLLDIDISRKGAQGSEGEGDFLWYLNTYVLMIYSVPFYICNSLRRSGPL